MQTWHTDISTTVCMKVWANYYVMIHACCWESRRSQRGELPLLVTCTGDEVSATSWVICICLWHAHFFHVNFKLLLWSFWQCITHNLCHMDVIISLSSQDSVWCTQWNFPLKDHFWQRWSFQHAVDPECMLCLIMFQLTSCNLFA